MTPRKTLIAVSLVSILPVLGFAQHVAPIHIVPVVAKAKGLAGTDWVSDVAISNLDTRDVAVQLQFFPENTDNRFPSPHLVTMALMDGQTVLLADVLGTRFPAVGNTKGALLIIAQDPSGVHPEPPLAVTSRTYNNADPNRTYGQSVPSTMASLVWGAGKAVLTGVRQDSRFRTNIGVLNLSEAVPNPPRLRVKVRILGPYGAPIREVTKEIQSLSLQQWSLPDLGVSELPVGRVEVVIDPTDPLYQPCQVRRDVGEPGALFLAYYSKVDNATGDAEFALGQVDWSAYQSCPQPPQGDPCR